MATRTPYGAPGNKFSQGPITVSETMTFPEIQLALNNMNRWSTPIKNGVASVLSNRSCFYRVNATANENAQFDLLMAKVGRCMDSDANFAQLMDPCYVLVNFGDATVPADYREWLDEMNAQIGGSPVGEAGQGKFNVTATADQPIKFLDPKMQNLNVLHLNTREHADYVAAQLKLLGGLSSWVWETDLPPTFR